MGELERSTGEGRGDRETSATETISCPWHLAYRNVRNHACSAQHRAVKIMPQNESVEHDERRESGVACICYI